MSQHDFNIANQGFPATRADLNNALQALASNSSGDAEPSTTFANQWWYETDTNTLKLRNEANNAWLSFATVDQSTAAWTLAHDVSITGTTTLAGASTTADITFGDNDKAIFGAGSDLQIYHSGTESFVDDAGTGSLYIRSNSVVLGKYTGEVGVVATADGSVDLYHNDVLKFATNSAGVAVTSAAGTGGSAAIKVTDSTGGGIAQLMRTGSTYSYAGVGANETWLYSSGTTNLTMGPDGGGNIKFVTSGAERMKMDSVGKFGVGITPTRRLHVASYGATKIGTAAGALFTDSANDGGVLIGSDNLIGNIQGCNAAGTSAKNIIMQAEGGDVFINQTGTYAYANGKVCINADGSGNPCLVAGVSSTSAATNNIILGNSTGAVGRIQTNGSTTTYLTTSDYRLKSDVKPVENAIAVIGRLNPVSYTWNTDGRNDAGFLAHEFQEVLPNYADGVKDGVDSKGNPDYQAVDKSGAIPYLVKAIQEQQAIITALTDRVTALEG
jgi:hypothetical protein